MAESRGEVRYFPFGRFLKQTFGAPVRKITVNPGFDCPNRDGTISTEGCIFCNNLAFSPSLAREQLPVAEQVAREIERHAGRGVDRFLVYFQPFTNTYAPVDRLREAYDAALGDARVAGLAVGTRPDCVSDEVLDLLADYAKEKHVWIEYGLQSSHDGTLQAINRGHAFADFVDAVERTAGRNIFIAAHVILGLPGETRDDMVATAVRLSKLPLDGLKLHHLHVVKGTPLERMYRDGGYTPLTLDEYVGLAADFLEHTSESVCIQRLVGEVRGGMLVAPVWETSKQKIHGMINAELARRDSRQGEKVGT